MCLAFAATWACTACTASREQVVRPFEDVTVRVASRIVEIEGWSCLDAGWLEQVACSPGTREHEALVVIEVRPSDIHAALLLAGFEPGAPGRWSLVNDEVRLTPPSGDPLDILVRYERGGTMVEEPIASWITGPRDGAPFPDASWIFGGSLMAPNAEWMGPGEHYVADYSGSIIGLVTFGDEVIGFAEVLSDDETVQPPAFQVNTDKVPPIGTPVTLILKRAE